MTDHRIHGYARLPWDEARALLDGCECTWADLDGIHLTDAPPERLPVGATHLWGWSAARYVRVRFDLDTVHLAVLTTESPTGEPPLNELTPAPRWREAIIWGDGDHQVGPLPDAVRRTWELGEIPGEAPITFVRAR
ncbi:hypothetical protein [Streptomyces alkaliphilus]|uniref:hypothetical protein n=1 Tax=Streptomyces alkaliphilus TaxID=1472722 RepID=UPI00117EC3F1|nr:hypothetical protein [Streptomyces alkaliphilus]MQS09973.1 hypothetical protein [Streptomyces alkaliphilus]